MLTVILIVLGLVYTIGALVLILGLCRQAAKADRQSTAHAEPSHDPRQGTTRGRTRRDPRLRPQLSGAARRVHRA
jgi:hypothetical protein